MTLPGNAPLRHPAFRASWLALIAGLCDGLGWLQTGLFAAQMTGNTALLGVALAERHWGGAAQKAAAIFCFLAGSLVSRLLLRPGQGSRQGRVLAILVATLLIVLAAFLPRPVNVLVLGAALGGQNAVFTRFGGQSINTSFVSGDLQKLGQVLASLMAGTALDDGDRVVLVTVPSLWLAYVAGAAAGVFCGHGLALPLLVPAVMLPLVLLLPKDSSELAG
nr:YoaK family protein [uncultured Lichenicoccus sp.]